MIVDAEILRVIFILLGGLLILGVYFWERLSNDEEGAETGWPEPSARAMDGLIIPASGRFRVSNSEKQVEEGKKALFRLVGSSSKAKDAGGGRDSSSQKKKLDSSAQSEYEMEKDDHWNTSFQGLILQLTISSKSEGQFNGLDILRAMQRVDLKADDAGIFYHYEDVDDQEVIIFGVASMVKPGAFPMQNLGEFKTPGITLFTQLPGPMDGIAMFSTMLASARIIAKELNGELQDETYSRLTNQTVEHIHSQITEYQRQAQLSARRGQ